MRRVVGAGAGADSHGHLLRGIAAVSVLTTLVKLLGGIKVVLIAKWFGSTDPLDAFLVAFLLPSFLAEVVGASFNSALIPKLIEVREEGGNNAARNLLSGVNWWSTGLLLSVTALLAAFAHPLLRWVALGFPIAKLELTHSLLLLMLPVVFFGGTSSIWRGVLTADDRIRTAAITPILTPLVILLLLLLFRAQPGIRILAAGTVLGSMLEFIIAGVVVRRLHWPLWPGGDWRATGVKQVMRQYVGSLVWSVVAGSSLFVDQAVAASLGPGSVSKLNFGTRISSLAVAIGPVAVGTVFLPHFSRLRASGAWPQIRSGLRVYSWLIVLLATPAALLLLFLSEDLVRIIFERGAFSSADTREVARIQQFAVLQIPFAILSALLGRLLSALQANYLLTRGGVLNLVATVALDIALARHLGVAGIALAASIVNIVAVIWLSFSLSGILRAERGAA